MTGTERITFFVDVDNTLIDNDAAKVEMDHRMERLIGSGGSARFWEIYETVRAERSVVDIPTTLSRYLQESGDRDLGFALADLFMLFPFKDFVYPSTLSVISHLRAMGRVAILSDGDAVFQVAKITRSGLAAAVDGYLLVYPHKEEHLPEITSAFAADTYVLIDDKPGVIEKVARRLAKPLTTIFVRQGRYASSIPTGDWTGSGLTVDSIGGVCSLSRETILSAGRGTGEGYLRPE